LSEVSFATSAAKGLRCSDSIKLSGLTIVSFFSSFFSSSFFPLVLYAPIKARKGFDSDFGFSFFSSTFSFSS